MNRDLSYTELLATAQGLAIEGTGGGCRAYQYPTKGNGYIWITEPNGGALPKDFDSPSLVGWYDAAGGALGTWMAATLESAIKMIGATPKRVPTDVAPPARSRSTKEQPSEPTVLSLDGFLELCRMYVKLSPAAKEFLHGVVDRGAHASDFCRPELTEAAGFLDRLVAYAGVEEAEDLATEARDQAKRDAALFDDVRLQ